MGIYNMLKKTKIICTQGPSTEKPGVIDALIENGMNLARFNFSHGDHEEQKGRMDMLKKIRVQYFADLIKYMVYNFLSGEIQHQLVSCMNRISSRDCKCPIRMFSVQITVF